MAADLETWSYYIHEVQIDDLKERKGLTAAFKTLGDDGWELVSSSSAIRPPQQFGNPIVFVFKKRCSGHKPGVLDPDAPTLKLHRATSSAPGPSAACRVCALQLLTSSSRLVRPK